MLACRANIVASSPQLASPVHALQARIFGVQLTRGDAFDHIHHLCGRISGRTTDKQVYVVFLYRQRLDLPVARRTDLTNQFLQPSCDIANQHLTTVARNPDKVIGQPVYRMCATTCFHSAQLYHDPLHAVHYAARTSLDIIAREPRFPPCGGPAFLPAASDGVSSRRTP